MANIIEIHDFSDPALDVYARLTENRSSSAVRLMRAVSRCRF